MASFDVSLFLRQHFQDIFERPMAASDEARIRKLADAFGAGESKMHLVEMIHKYYIEIKNEAQLAINWKAMMDLQKYNDLDTKENIDTITKAWRKDLDRQLQKLGNKYEIGVLCLTMGMAIGIFIGFSITEIGRTWPKTHSATQPAIEHVDGDLPTTPDATDHDAPRGANAGLSQRGERAGGQSNRRRPRQQRE